MLTSFIDKFSQRAGSLGVSNFERIVGRRIGRCYVASVTVKINLENFLPDMNDCPLERCIPNFDGE
jgi:hypothetical protein